MKKQLIALAIAFIAVASMDAQAVGPQHPGRSQPERVMSLSQNGTDVTLRLESGKTVQVAAQKLMIADRSQRPNNDKATTNAEKHQRLSIATLSAMSSNGPLPAVATIIYARDGSVRRARMFVFASGDETTAFLHRDRAAKQ